MPLQLTEPELNSENMNYVSRVSFNHITSATAY
jgi:hypothetical protein